MIGIVVLGTAVMDAGILLLLLERWMVSRRPRWSQLTAASTGRVGTLLDHIAQVDDETARLDHAIDVALPERPEDDRLQDAPTRVEVVDAYTSAGARLAALSDAHLRRSPSTALRRFVELGSGLGDDDRDLHAEDLTALLGHLHRAGDALRAERRRPGPGFGLADGDLHEVHRELRRTVVARLDSLRPLLIGGRRRRRLREPDRAMLVEQSTRAARQLAAADVLARRSPLASLRALAALQLPTAACLPPDTAFVRGCRVVEAGLRVCVAQADAGLSRQIAHCAVAIDAHLTRLHAVVTAESRERRRRLDADVALGPVIPAPRPAPAVETVSAGDLSAVDA